jgi:hypothetical protein
MNIISSSSSCTIPTPTPTTMTSLRSTTTTYCLVLLLLLRIDGVRAAWSIATRTETAACSRRRAAIVGGAAALGLLAPPVVQAQDNNDADTPLLQVTLTLNPKDILELATMPETSALYVTARPNTVDNVPRAILDGSRGKAPPVLVARIANIRSLTDFPLVYTMTARDVTVEGAGNWWRPSDSRAAPLIVSARWDSDGVAATRDPSDWVGRSIVATTSSGLPPTVVVELQGRGAAGKYVTRKK